MVPSSGKFFSKTSLFNGPGISLTRRAANKESKDIVPEVFFACSVKIIVSVMFEKSLFVYKTNFMVRWEPLPGCDVSFLQDRMANAQTNRMRNAFFNFLFY